MNNNLTTEQIIEAVENKTLNEIKDQLTVEKLATQDNWGTTALHMAAACGSLDQIKEFLTPDILKLQDRWQQTPVHLAAYTCHLDQIKDILTPEMLATRCIFGLAPISTSRCTTLRGQVFHPPIFHLLAPPGTEWHFYASPVKTRLAHNHLAGSPSGVGSFPYRIPLQSRHRVGIECFAFKCLIDAGDDPCFASANLDCYHPHPATPHSPHEPLENN